jgi:hypothetical protein
MSQLDKDPLDTILGQWKAPEPPPHLSDALSKAYRHRLAPRG